MTLQVILAIAAVTSAGQGSTANRWSGEKLLRFIEPSVRFHPRQIPDSRNGWVLFRKLDKLQASQELLSIRSGALNPATAKELLQNIEPHNGGLDHAVAVSRLPDWQEPLSYSTPRNDRLDNFRACVRLLTLRGRARIAAGYSEAGTDDLIAGFQIAGHFENACASNLTWLAATIYKSRAESDMLAAISQPGIRPGDLQKLIDSIPAPPAIDHSAQNSLRANLETEVVAILSSKTKAVGLFEAFEQMEGLDGRWRVIGSLPNSYDPRRTVETMSRCYAILVANLARPWAQRRPTAPVIAAAQKGWPKAMTAEFGKVTQEQAIDSLPQFGKLPNLLGNLFVATAIPSMDVVVDESFRNRTQQNATRLIMALKLWSMTHGGKYPQSVSELVDARILTAHPKDFFSGQPFHFDSRRRIFWSVGGNGKNDGGTGQAGRSKGLDNVWRFDGVVPKVAPKQPSSRS